MYICIYIHIYIYIYIADMDKTTCSKPIAVISEWWLVTINYELRIRKTCVDFISVRIKTSIFFPIRVLS